MMRWWLLLLALPAVSNARVFNFKDAAMSAYVRGTSGLSNLNRDAFSNSSGQATVFNDQSNYNYGGEVGFVFGLSQNLHLRLGAEVIQNTVVQTDGLNAAGASLFTLKSTVFVFNPNLAFEVVLKAFGSSRFFGTLGAGYANVTVVNNYTMTAAGTAALGPTDFNETMETNLISYNVGFAYEALFLDNVTFIADLNYRYLPVKSMKYKNDVNNIVAYPGSAHKGDTVVNHDGSTRKLNLGGLYGGVAFRFYLNFL